MALAGMVALGIASHARAEGGEGSSVIPPDQFSAPSAPAAAGAPPADARPATTASTAVGAREARGASRSADAVRAGAVRPLIARYASEHEIPFSLADAVIRLESRYNPHVRNGANVGLTQINVRTAQSLGYQGSAVGLMDAETNLRYGLAYLGEAYRLAGGDTCGALLRFQFGHRAQAANRASRSYCARVKTLAAAAE